MKKSILPALGIVIVFYACNQQIDKPANSSDTVSAASSAVIADNAAKCNTTVFTYSLGIKPIMKANCTTAGCHTHINPAWGVDLTTYVGVHKVALSGQLIGSVKHLVGYYPMPLGLPMLSKCNLTVIQKWINAGSLNN